MAKLKQKSRAVESCCSCTRLDHEVPEDLVSPSRRDQFPSLNPSQEAGSEKPKSWYSNGHLQLSPDRDLVSDPTQGQCPLLGSYKWSDLGSWMHRNRHGEVQRGIGVLGNWDTRGECIRNEYRKCLTHLILSGEYLNIPDPSL